MRCMAEAYDVMRCKTQDDVVRDMAEAYDLMRCRAELLALSLGSLLMRCTSQP